MSRFPAPWEPANILGQAPVSFAQQRPSYTAALVHLLRVATAADHSTPPVARRPPPAARRPPN